MSEFITSKRRESYLAHTSCPVGESVKRELLVAPGPDNLCLIQPLRLKVVCTIKEALLLSSTASLGSSSTAASRGRSGASGAGGYASPLVFSRPSTSGYRKESNRYRRLYVAPLAGVERRGRGTLGCGGLAVGNTRFPSVGLPPYPGIPSLYRRMPSGGRGSGPAEQGCHRAGSASISRLLQPVICGYESFRGVETGHRPFHSELEDSADILQDGDTSIRSSLGSSGGLDGVSGLEGWVLAGANAPGFTQVPQFHGGGEGVPVQGTLLRPFHGSASFTRVMAPVSAILHRMGVRLRRYLDGWLLQASSREQVLLALRTVLQLCRRLGIVVNWEKSQVIPTQQMVYLGVILDATAFRASPALKRVEKLLSIGDVFLSCVSQPVSSWLELLGVLSSMIQLVPGGRLRMRLLQLTLRRQWAQIDQSQLVEWSPVIQDDLSWWLDRDRLVLGVSLEQVSPQFELWSDASDVGWGAHLDEQVASGLWGPEDVERSVNARELLAIERALKWFAPLLAGSSSGGLRRQFDSRVVSAEPRRDSFFFSELHRSEDSPLGRGSVSSDFPTVYYGETQCASGRSFSPKPDLGLRVDAEAGGLQGLVQEVAGVNRPVCNISKSQMFHIFFSLPRSQCYGDGCASSKLEWVAGVCLSSLVSHSGGFEEAPVVLWSSTDHRSSILASEAMVSGSSGSVGRRPGRSSAVQRPSASAPLPPVSSGSVQAVSSCLETIKRFTRAGGFSRRVAQQVSLARRPSSRAGYQSKWLVFRQWCRSEGHSISCPSLPKIADFLFWL